MRRYQLACEYRSGAARPEAGEYLYPLTNTYCEWGALSPKMVDVLYTKQTLSSKQKTAQARASMIVLTRRSSDTTLLKGIHTLLMNYHPRMVLFVYLPYQSAYGSAAPSPSPNLGCRHQPLSGGGTWLLLASLTCTPGSKQWCHPAKRGIIIC